jgi:hypothetical protein
MFHNHFFNNPQSASQFPGLGRLRAKFMSTPKINSSQIKACVNEIENYEQILEM